MAQQEEKYDIFVSYAHVDNTEVLETPWVSTLIKHLRLLLDVEMGKVDSTSIWRDKTNLNSYDPVTPEIHQKVQNSSNLLIILSPGYMESKWCQEEMTLFLQTLETNPHKRVFIAYKKQLNENQPMPAEFKDLLGYRFWYREEESSRVRTMTIHDEQPHKTNFINLVHDLAADISNHLKVLKAETPSPSMDPIATVYLAEVTDDLIPLRDKVQRFLEDEQIQVLPKIRHLEGQIFKEALIKELPQCCLFIQLLGKVVGKTSPEIPQGYARLQIEQAQLSNISILQWRDPNLEVNESEVESPEQRELLTGKTVISETLRTFSKKVVEAATKPKEIKSLAPHETSDESLKSVFINADEQDQQLAKKILTQMDSRLIGNLPKYGGKPKEIRKHLEEKIRECDALILVYGVAPPYWVGMQISRCYHIRTKYMHMPVKIFGIYDGPPKEKQDISTVFPEIITLPFRNGLNPQILNEFLAPLLDGVSDDQ